MFTAVFCLHLAYGLPLGIAAGVWASLLFGSAAAYRAFQAQPDAPPEAFNDTGPVGALFLGWLPSSLLVSLTCMVARLLRRASRSPAPRS